MGMPRSRKKTGTKPEHNRTQTLMHFLGREPQSAGAGIPESFRKPPKERKKGRTQSSLPSTSSSALSPFSPLTPASTTPFTDSLISAGTNRSQTPGIDRAEGQVYDMKTPSDKMLYEIITGIERESGQLIDNLQMAKEREDGHVQDDEQLRGGLVALVSVPYSLAKGDIFWIEIDYSLLGMQIIKELTEKLVLGELKTKAEAISWFLKTEKKVFDLIEQHYAIFEAKKVKSTAGSASELIDSLTKDLTKEGLGGLCHEIASLFKNAHQRLADGTKATKFEYPEGKRNHYIVPWRKEIAIDCKQISHDVRRVYKLQRSYDAMVEALWVGNFKEANRHKAYFLFKTEKYLQSSSFSTRAENQRKIDLLHQVQNAIHPIFDEIDKIEKRRKQAGEVKKTSGEQVVGTGSQHSLVGAIYLKSSDELGFSASRVAVVEQKGDESKAPISEPASVTPPKVVVVKKDENLPPLDEQSIQLGFVHNKNNPLDNILFTTLLQERKQMDDKGYLHKIQSSEFNSDKDLRDALCDLLVRPNVFSLGKTGYASFFKIEIEEQGFSRQIMDNLGERIHMGEIKTSKVAIAWFSRITTDIYALINEANRILQTTQQSPFALGIITEELRTLREGLQKEGFGSLCQSIETLFVNAQRRLTKKEEKTDKTSGLGLTKEPEKGDFFSIMQGQPKYIAPWKFHLDFKRITNGDSKKEQKLQSLFSKIDQAFREGKDLKSEINPLKDQFVAKVKKYLQPSFYSNASERARKEKTLKETMSAFDQYYNNRCEILARYVDRNRAPVDLSPVERRALIASYTKRRSSYDRNGDLKPARGLETTPDDSQDGSQKKRPDLVIDTNTTAMVWHSVPPLLSTDEGIELQSAPPELERVIDDVPPSPVILYQSAPPVLQSDEVTLQRAVSLPLVPTSSVSSPTSSVLSLSMFSPPPSAGSSLSPSPTAAVISPDDPDAVWSLSSIPGTPRSSGQ